jgi:nucleotide-binding universal stress UspA family protein
LQAIAPDVEFIIITNGGLILENIQKLSLQYASSLIVMGITGKNKLEQKVVGSNTIKVGLNSDIPVLIIPPNAKYAPIKNVALALPFKKNLLDFVPFEAINTLKEKLGASLMVVNVEKKGENIPNNIVYSSLQSAHYMFGKSGATFHMISDDHVADAITAYALSNDAQVIISIAEEHNFIQYLFKGSVTTRLAFHSNIPLLVYKAGQSYEE